jgi:hypothetical protein
MSYQISPYLRGLPNPVATPIPSGPMPRDLVKAIAMDIGKAVAHHIETMYPDAVKATNRNMLVSVRGCVVNEIMAALDTTDEQEIRARLAKRKDHRRKIKKAYTTIRRKV